jgi:hypothetical protein
MGLAVDTEIRFGRDQKNRKRRRSFLGILFDPFYPLFITIFFGSFAVWYFQIPLRQYLDFDLASSVRNLVIRWFY